MKDKTTQRPALPKLRVMMSMPCADVGVGLVCRSLIRGALMNGFDADLFTSRSDSRHGEPFSLHAFTPRLLQSLPHRLTRQLTVRRLHAAYLTSLQEGEVAYLWPSVPLDIFRLVRQMGHPIVYEAINTRMADAMPILDKAYIDLGLIPPHHRITRERIALEEALLAESDYVFSPSPGTDRSLARSPSGARALETSYGCWLPPSPPERQEKGPDDPVTFLFVGRSAIRKGLQHLLAAWRDVPANAHLKVIGFDEPAIGRIFQDVIDMPNVSVTGFQRDTASAFQAADVFVMPSLEEGDPLVTYEAAAHGLPVIASSVGAGRIGAQSGAILQIDTSNIT
ncbi:MAG: glycosyltransferase, partial [Paracoccaceae bacterium]